MKSLLYDEVLYVHISQIIIFIVQIYLWILCWALDCDLLALQWHRHWAQCERIEFNERTSRSLKLASDKPLAANSGQPFTTIDYHWQTRDDDTKDSTIKTKADQNVGTQTVATNVIMPSNIG